MPVQTTFSENIRAGIPGMVNKMVDYNAVSRNCATPGGIPFARAVSQGVNDTDAIIGGTANAFLGLTILDETIVYPIGTTYTVDTYPQYAEMGILTKGEMWATSAVAVVAGDPVTFIAVDGTLSNTGGVAIAGARWKFTRATPGTLNVVQLGIQR